MKELVEVIAKALVDDPESVTVNERTEKKTTILEVRVADSDMGKVIGKQGRIARPVSLYEERNVSARTVKVLRTLPDIDIYELIRKSGGMYGTVIAGRCHHTATRGARRSESLSDYR